MHLSLGKELGADIPLQGRSGNSRTLHRFLSKWPISSKAELVCVFVNLLLKPAGLARYKPRVISRHSDVTLFLASRSVHTGRQSVAIVSSHAHQIFVSEVCDILFELTVLDHKASSEAVTD